MSWNDVLIYVVECVCGVIVSIGIPMLIKKLQTKTDKEWQFKLIENAGDIIKKCVIMIDQTYVDHLKDIDAFDREEQKVAFDMCKKEILRLLNEETKKAIVSVFGNLDCYLETYIEANVRQEAAPSFCKLEDNSEEFIENGESDDFII